MLLTRALRAHLVCELYHCAPGLNLRVLGFHAPLVDTANCSACEAGFWTSNTGAALCDIVLPG